MQASNGDYQARLCSCLASFVSREIIEDFVKLFGCLSIVLLMLAFGAFLMVSIGLFHIWIFS